MEARIAILEHEATRLRAEIAHLQDEIRWLTGDEEEWMERGRRVALPRLA